MSKDEYVMFCKCGCREGVVLKVDKECGDLSIQFVSDNFYLMQRKGRMSLREKIKRIWYIITGKEYCYFDVLIDEDELQEFKKFVASL